ncbi:MAG: DUF2723 domain-containing protein [Anaerolineae bacterium]
MTQKQSPLVIYLLLSFSIPLAAYILTAPADLTLGIFGADSGELITASQTGGIPHPHGYPTWVIVSRLFAQLPIGRTLAHRYNLFSAVCMSLSMLTLFQACQLKLSKRLPVASLAAVLAIAFTLTVWSQAVITEVYALNSLLVSGVILLIANVDQSGASSKQVFLLGLIGGLSATTHLTSILLLPATGLILISRLYPKGWLAVMKAGIWYLASFVLGLTPFLLLFSRAGSSSPVVWGDTSTISGWWWMVSGVIYRPNVISLSAGDMIGRIQSFLFENQLAFVALFIPAAAILGGATTLINRQVPNENRTNQLTTDYKLPILMLLTAALYAFYALAYNTQDWRVFLLPGVLCLALPLVLGLRHFGIWSLALPLLLIAVNLPILLNGRTDETRNQAERVFTQAPADAILLTDGRDETVFPIWYFRYAENLRPDTLVVDQNLFAFDWYRARLAKQNPSLQAVQVDDLTQFRQQNSQTRPICEISLHPFALSCTDR